MAIKRLSGRSVSRVANPSRRRRRRMRRNPANAALGRYNEILNELKVKHPNSKHSTLQKKASAMYAKEKKGGGSAGSAKANKAKTGRATMSRGRKNIGSIPKLAKKIRKPGEEWKDVMRRAAAMEAGGSAGGSRGGRKSRYKSTKELTFSLPARKQRVGVTLYKNPGLVVAGVDMAPVAVGAVGAVAINQLFGRVDFLKKNVIGNLPAQAQPYAPSLVAILSGVLLHAGASRGYLGPASDFFERHSGYIAAAGLVLGLHQLTNQLIDKYGDKFGMSGAYGKVGMSGAYGRIPNMGGAYLQTGKGGLQGAYVQTPGMNGVKGGAGMFGGISNLA